ncbi:MAG TPA: tetratricopeptide repeat protein [Oligoflexia bacterium]|nr:tetratricopeptide repeat protein [Oligoflexia bacterium]HMR24054.1 tetratricopeptide repeat protein [Oligoflexia bacterium]
MARSKRKQFRDEIKAPDQFENFWDSIGGWFGEHKQKIIAIVALIILVAVGISYKKSLNDKHNVVAMDAFIELQAEIKTLDNPKDKVEKINQFIDQYKKADIVGMAYMYAGVENMNANKSDEAKKSFQLAKENLPENQKVLAMESLANLASKQGQLEEAQNIYKQILEMEKLPLKDYYTWNLIVLYKQNNKQEALNNLCANFSENYPESSFIDKVKIYCAQ